MCWEICQSTVYSTSDDSYFGGNSKVSSMEGMSCPRQGGSIRVVEPESGFDNPRLGGVGYLMAVLLEIVCHPLTAYLIRDKFWEK